MSTQDAANPSRTERKKEVTKKKIISVAMQLFQKHGYEATTMEQIADTVDIAKGTLYNYFPVKEAILGEYIQRSFQDKNAARIVRLRELPDTRSRMIFIINDLIPVTTAQKEIVEKFLIYRVQNILSLHKAENEKTGIQLLVEEILFLGQKAGEIRADLPSGILEDQFEFVFIEVVKQLARQPDTLKPDPMIERCVDLYLNGALTRKFD